MRQCNYSKREHHSTDAVASKHHRQRFPNSLAFFFFWEIRLGEESGCVEQKQSWTNFCTAQTHTQHVPMAALRHGTKQRLLLSRAGSKDR